MVYYAVGKSNFHFMREPIRSIGWSLIATIHVDDHLRDSGLMKKSESPKMGLIALAPPR